MAPDIGDRLRTVIRALEETVLPAMDAANRPAREQAQLCLMMLRMISDQHAFAYHLALVELHRYGALLERLNSAAAAALPTRLASTLADAVAERTGTVRVPSQAAVEARTRRYRDLADAVMEATAGIPAAAVRESVTAAVIEASRWEAMARRAWMAGSGVEPDPGQLPTIEQLVAEVVQQEG